MLRIVLISEHKLFRQALAGLLRDAESTRCAIRVDEVDFGPDAPDRLEASRPDVALLHVTRPMANSIGLLHQMREKMEVPVVVLIDPTEEGTDEQVIRSAMQAGAAGYVDSTADTRELAEALEEAASGRIAVSANCARRLARAFVHSTNGHGPKSTYPESLTTREKEVLTLLADGRTNLEIARGLFMSESTVRAHLRTITQKLGAHNRVHAVARALELGMLLPPVASANGVSAIPD